MLKQNSNMADPHFYQVNSESIELLKNRRNELYIDLKGASINSFKYQRLDGMIEGIDLALEALGMEDR